MSSFVNSIYKNLAKFDSLHCGLITTREYNRPQDCMMFYYETDISVTGGLVIKKVSINFPLFEKRDCIINFYNGIGDWTGSIAGKNINKLFKSLTKIMEIGYYDNEIR